MADDTDNVIRFPFGRRNTGTSQKEPPPSPSLDAGGVLGPVSGPPVAGAPITPARPSNQEPVRASGGEAPGSENLFSYPEAARVFGFTEGRLRYWSKSGFLVPSGRAGRRRFYTFRDLIGLRVAKTLLAEGIPLRRVRLALDSLQEKLPAVERPLAELRIVARGEQVLVHDADRAFEPTTGQLVMDFEVASLEQDVVRVLAPVDRSAERRQRAYELYLEGCRQDEEDGALQAAEKCYLHALELDPTLSNALTNLGNIRFRQGAVEDAEGLYRQALEVDAAQPEAHYNLGFLAYERGEAEEAAFRFEQAIEEDPSFADAHFNLAMALEELQRSADAQPHWRVYLELDPGGPWAAVARRYLRKT